MASAAVNSDGGDAGDEEEESETGFRCRAVASDVPKLLQKLYEDRHLTGELHFVREDNGSEVDVAHLAVLQLQSPVLKAMLRSDMQEAKTHCVQVQTEFADVWPNIIRFWYGLPVHVSSFETAVTLRRVAQYYESDELKAITVDLLMAARPSAARMALVAESLSFEAEFADRAWSYLEAHPRELFASSAWPRLSEATVAELLRRDGVRCREPGLLRALARWARARRDNTPETGASGDGSRPGVVVLPEALLQLVRFENMSPSELRSAAKPVLPAERYIELLEEVSGATPSRQKRSVRERPMRPFRCNVCGIEVFVTTESGVPGDAAGDGGIVTADGGPLPECRRYHPGFTWNALACADHKGKCSTCKRCNSARWTCCQMAEGSIGCRRRPHEWHEVGGAQRWWDTAVSSKRPRLSK
ncbi:KEAP1 [Symbiodinium sp. CCMP2592]|nr:KEAP1 [Symbiodinium sp. CCMP2592]